MLNVGNLRSLIPSVNIKRTDFWSIRSIIWQLTKNGKWFLVNTQWNLQHKHTCLKIQNVRFFVTKNPLVNCHFSFGQSVFHLWIDESKEKRPEMVHLKKLQQGGCEGGYLPSCSNRRLHLLLLFLVAMTWIRTQLWSRTSTIVSDRKTLIVSRCKPGGVKGREGTSLVTRGTTNRNTDEDPGFKMTSFTKKTCYVADRTKCFE